MTFHIRMAGLSRIKVSMELQVSDLAMELQILVLCQISDDTMKTDFISFARLLALGCKSTYSSQYVRSGASSQEHELHQHRQKNSNVDQRWLEDVFSTWSIDH